MRLRLLALIAALSLLAAGLAQSLVVYPFDGRDPALGAVVADELAAALQDELDVYGPAVAPSLVPPLPVADGFLNPTAFLGGAGVANDTGARLLQSALGADAVLTGAIERIGDELEASLFLGREGGVDAYAVSAPASEPGLLATRALRATASRLGLEPPLRRLEIDLSGAEGLYGQALALAGAGLLGDARAVLEQLEEPQGRAAQLLRAIELVEQGAEGQGADPALLATLALNRAPLDEPLAVRYFEEFAGERELPAAQLWLAVLRASLNDLSGARQAFAALPATYPYGLAGSAAFELAEDPEAGEAALRQAAAPDDVAALLAVAATAEEAGLGELEKESWRRLTRLAPFFAYPFERLSFIAFDENDALAAAEALAVAVQLEPESDLYWTNLGWAYYLLGMLERSEEASLRAVQLDPAQFIANYNLGLARVVVGRLEEAMSAYQEALAVDPEVDDAAIADLEQALQLYPDRPEVHYPLAVLYEAEGRRAEAAEQYRLYLEDAEAGPFADRAAERIRVLSAPPPPIEIPGPLELALGSAGIGVEAFHPGDRLFPSFEVYTPGEELPQRLEVRLAVIGPDGTVAAERQETVSVPANAIGFVIDRLPLDLPLELPPGEYRLEVEASASEGRQASVAAPLEVVGEPQLIRRLLSRSITLQALDTGVPLYTASDLAQGELLLDVLVAELAASAEAAEQALPEASTGRFEGMSGGEIFEASTAADVRDFLEYLLASEAADSSIVFAEAYAQWALEGAPTP